TIRGRVSGPNGAAIANAAVTLKITGGTSMIAANKTNQNGEYLFNVREGRYEVRVSAPSYLAASHVVDARAGSVAQGDFSLKPATQESTSGRSQPGRVTPPGRPQVVKPGRLLGQVLDAKTGRPLAGATVSVAGQKSITTDTAGNFAFTNLFP